MLAFVGYALLFFAPFFGGIPGLIGIVLAYIRRNAAPPLERSHFRFQIRIFWTAFLLLVVAALGLLAGFGILFNDLLNAATNNGEGWDAWEAASFDMGQVTFHGEMVIGFIVAVLFAVLSALWLMGASVVGFARLAGSDPIGRA